MSYNHAHTDNDEGEEDAFVSPDTVPDDWESQVIDFWFDAHGHADWFGGGPAFDAEVTEKFADIYAALRSQPVEAFTIGTMTALAAIILFDQMPRNMFRGSAEAFATDPLALGIAKVGVSRGFDTVLDTDKKVFFYLPFEHSEDLDDQRESLRLMGSLDNPEYLQYAQAHFDIIKAFGRFPHRNKVLGRADRPGEADAIAEGSNW